MDEIVLTREDANSESALLVEWLVPDGDTVRKGDPVCVIETTKSAIEVEAPGPGTLCHLVPAGEDVPLGSRIAVVASGDGELAEAARLRESAAAQQAVSAPAQPGKVTRKALELATAHGIDVTGISKAGFITAEDVEAVIAARQAEAALPALGAVAGLLAGISLERVSLSESLALDETAGRLDEGFLHLLGTDPDSVRDLPEAARIELYREHGAQIGEDVRLGAATLIDAPRIVLGDGVEVGDRSTLTCGEVLAVGAGTKFGSGLRIRCRQVFIGEGGYFSENVEIGGGGSRDPQAIIVIGDLAFVGSEAFLNPCRPIVIGREVFVTMRSVLVTHNIGHSTLEGFENRFAPIVLEDRSQVGIGAVVYAGCRIGAESIVASNSYVVADIPPGRLAIGVPARATGHAHRTVAPAERVRLTERMMSDLYELLELRGHDVDAGDEGPARDFLVRTGGSTSRVAFVERLDGRFDEAPGVDGETVVLTLEPVEAVPDGLSVLELLERRAHGPGGVVLDSVREFCRKRGIRFEPGPWRYRGGLV